MTSTTDSKRNVWVLVGAQALFQTVSVLTMTVAGLAGLELASDKALATLPIALMMLAAAVFMIPASLAMQRFGRRAGFIFGSGLGCLAGLVAAYAIWIESFWLFAVAAMLIGTFQSFAQYYRFAAAEAASDKFRSRAISWVIGGGVVAAVAGPNIARVTHELGAVPFLYSFIALAILSLLSGLLLTQLSLTGASKPTENETQSGETDARPLWEIMRQRVFLTALIGSTVGFSLMVLVMTATPLSMQMHGFHPGQSATVIQWHVLGMFLPSFFTGSLITRFGVLPIMTAGIAFLAAHVLIASNGIAYMHYLSGLTLVGLGWNFLFIGGTTLMTESYRPSERAKTQAAHDFLMFGFVSLASFSAGGLLDRLGWGAISFVLIPFLLIAAIAVLSLAANRRKFGLSEVK